MVGAGTGAGHGTVHECRGWGLAGGGATLSSGNMALLTTFNQPSVNNSTFSLFSKN